MTYSLREATTDLRSWAFANYAISIHAIRRFQLRKIRNKQAEISGEDRQGLFLGTTAPVQAMQVFTSFYSVGKVSWLVGDAYPTNQLMFPYRQTDLATLQCLCISQKQHLKTAEFTSIIMVTRSSVVGAGSNPAAALVLVALLSVLLILNTNIRRNAMMKMTEETKSKSCNAKRILTKLTMNLTHVFETIWATGVSVAAAMVISTPINLCGALISPRTF